jgi:hypothetical protein
VGWYLQRNTQILGDKPLTAPFCSSHNLHTLTRNLTPHLARGQRPAINHNRHCSLSELNWSKVCTKIQSLHCNQRFMVSIEVTSNSMMFREVITLDSYNHIKQTQNTLRRKNTEFFNVKRCETHRNHNFERWNYIIFVTWNLNSERGGVGVWV